MKPRYTGILLIDYGIYFGYPMCCVLELLENWKDSTKPGSRKLKGTGYVPCSKCNEMSEEDLIKAIEDNRRCKLPFPREPVRFPKFKVGG